MSNIDKQAYRADGGDIGTGRLREVADNPYGDEEKCWLAKRVLALQDELEAAEKRIAELEAREVSVPNVSSERFWVEFSGRLVFREETYRSAVFKALDAAGITVKGDNE
ncbi:DUF5320 domain-containing protein [Enterobacter hormaechei]